MFLSFGVWEREMSISAQFVIFPQTWTKDMGSGEISE
jgi:hypothetical protein